MFEIFVFYYFKPWRGVQGAEARATQVMHIGLMQQLNEDKEKTKLLFF